MFTILLFSTIQVFPDDPSIEMDTYSGLQPRAIYLSTFFSVAEYKSYIVTIVSFRRRFSFSGNKQTSACSKMIQSVSINAWSLWCRLLNDTNSPLNNQSSDKGDLNAF